MKEKDHPGVTVLFPGQGAQEIGMLDAFRHVPTFDERCLIASEALGYDLLTSDPNRNEIGSLLTVLASTFVWDEYQQDHELPQAVAGYSVGTWAALWSAGMIDFPTLIELLVERARLMDFAASEHDTGMLAVVGLLEEVIVSLVEEQGRQGGEIDIANFNAPGNYTLAGEVSALERAKTAALEAGARQAKMLKVSGGWHSPMMRSAGQEFRKRLEAVFFDSPRLPVVDNVTGDFMSCDQESLRNQLALHLHQPVQWERSIRTLIDSGCDRFIEVGHGHMLSRFGFFIDRSKEHQTFTTSSCAA